MCSPGLQVEGALLLGGEPWPAWADGFSLRVNLCQCDEWRMLKFTTLILCYKNTQVSVCSINLDLVAKGL